MGLMGGQFADESRHLMTGIGSYFYLVWAIWLRICLNEQQDVYMLNWPNIWTLPEVVLISDVKSTSNADKYRRVNGSNSEERKSV